MFAKWNYTYKQYFTAILQQFKLSVAQPDNDTDNLCAEIFLTFKGHWKASSNLLPKSNKDKGYSVL